MQKLALPELFKLIKKFSNEEYQYDINIEEGVIERTREFVIPKGPLAGQKTKKVEKIKIVKLWNILNKIFNLMQEKDLYLYRIRSEDMKSIFKSVNPAFIEYIENPEKIFTYVGSRKGVDLDDARLPFINYKSYVKINPLKPMIDALNVINELTSDRVIVISRAPVDLIRMSDFSGLQSCHSPPRPKRDQAGNLIRNQQNRTIMGGDYFDCAIQESKNNGAVAFLVPRDSVEQYESKLQDREFFKDIERDIEGSFPLQRLRLRRYLHIPTETELLVPEVEVYGKDPSQVFKERLLEWAREAQQAEMTEVFAYAEPPVHLNDFILIGGSYADSTTRFLLSRFFDKKITLKDSTPELEDVVSMGEDDPRMSERILTTSFPTELIKFTKFQTNTEFANFTRKKDSKTETVGDKVKQHITFRVDPFSVDKSKIPKISKDRNAIGMLALEAITKMLEANFDMKALEKSYEIRYPIYHPLVGNMDFVFELNLEYPKDAVFTREDIHKTHVASSLLNFLNDNNKLRPEIDKYLEAEYNLYYPKLKEA